MTKEWQEKKVSLGGAIIGAAVTLAIGLLVGLNWNSLSTTWGPYLGINKSDELDLSSLGYLYKQVRDNFDGDIDKSKLVEGAKKGLVLALGDDYTEYMNAQEAADYKSALEGDIGEAGIGIEMAKREEYVKVIRTLPDNPARKAGVLAGDIIFAIDDEEVWQLDATAISKKLRGEKGSKVKFTVVRDGKKKDFDLIREEINNVSADITYQDKTAIISVYRFATDTGDLVASFAEEMKNRGVDKIILDLRNNGGGYVNSAVKLISLWIDGEKVLTQKSRTELDVVTNAKRGMAVFKDMKTIVLVNGATASASEITAGALKDHHKATIVGEKTYGKGVVQTMLNADGGGILKITTAHWYTPNGTCINGEGIKPDVEVERTYEQINKDEDPQLEKAYELLN